MITRWGVLYNVREILDNQYCGKVFVRMGASGHLFNQHYLDPIFPLATTGGSDFLDQVVEVDEKTASRRESVTTRQMELMRRESSLENFQFGNGQTVPVAAVVHSERRTHGVVHGSGINFVEPTSGGVLQARGKTVRQLSRLWRYIDGGSPGPSHDQGANGVVEGLSSVASAATL